MPSAPPPAELRSTASGLGYQPALDGLRAVSVAAVILYHAGFEWMHGGFFGVEVFFVISGFLITSLLIDERVAGGGTDLLAFWARRARRLLPALFVMLVAVSGWALVAGTHEQTSQLRSDLPWSLLYAANWGQIMGEIPYFAPGDPPLLRHLWSLAVEEQWYLVWPLVFIGLSRLGWRARNTARLLLATAVAVYVLVLVLRVEDLASINFLYLSTITRSPGLLIGSALAFAWRPWRHSADRHPPVLLGVASVGVLCVLAICFVVGDVTSPVTYPWSMALVSCSSALAVFLVVHPNCGVMRTLLGNRPAAAIGRRSYGLYLWHWPVFVFVGATAGSWPRFLLGSMIAVVISELCYRYVELPVRRGALGRAWGRSHTAYLAGAFVLTAVITIVSVAVVRIERFDVAAGGEVEQFVLAVAAPPPAATPTEPTKSATDTVIPTTATSTAITITTSTSAGSVPMASTTASTSSTSTTTTTTTTLPILPRRVAIVGDSQANSLVVNLPSGIEDYMTITDGSVNGCGVHDVGQIVTRRSGFRNNFAICEGWAQQWADAAEDAEVALVVLGAWDVFDVRIDDRTVRFGTPAYEQLFERQLQQGLDALAYVGAHAALLQVPCMRPIDARGAGVPALPERGDDTRVARLNVMLRRIAAADPERVTFIEGPDEWCANEQIATDVDYRWDGVHVYARGANLVLSSIAQAVLSIPVEVTEE